MLTRTPVWSGRFRRSAQILDSARALGNGGALIFSGVRGKPTSATTLPKMLQHHRTAAVAHGFQNKAEAAYARSDLFERRRRLMDDWASVVCTR